MLAASSEAPNDKRYEPTARGSVITRMNSLKSIEPAISTSAASGSNTSALKKKVVKPNVSPKPGSTLGWRKLLTVRRPIHNQHWPAWSAYLRVESTVGPAD